MELKSITEAEMPVMLELLTDERIKQTYMLPDFESKEDAIPLFRRLCALSREKNRFVRGIFQEDQLVGFLNDVEIENGSIELGYVIHPNHWGKGFATAALKMAIAQLLEQGYQTVVTGSFAENCASIRVMEKAGMIRMEKQDPIEYHGKVYMCVYYSVETP